MSYLHLWALITSFIHLLQQLRLLGQWLRYLKTPACPVILLLLISLCLILLLLTVFSHEYKYKWLKKAWDLILVKYHLEYVNNPTTSLLVHFSDVQTIQLVATDISYTLILWPRWCADGLTKWRTHSLDARRPRSMSKFSLGAHRPRITWFSLCQIGVAGYGASVGLVSAGWHIQCKQQVARVLG